MRVLVADDEPLARRILEARLSGWGYGVESVADGEEAWRRIEAGNAPPLAVLDWAMPGLSGPELCRRIRRREGEDYLYVILLTGKARTEDMIEGLDAGADDYIVKPFSSEELRARLRAAERILNLHREVREEHHARETARHQHLAELREREERLRAILLSLHEVMILVLNREGRTMHAWGDPALGARYGVDIPALVGRTPAEYLPGPQAGRMMKRLREVFSSGRPQRTEERVSYPNGDFWQDASLCPMRAASQEVLAVVQFVKDITQRKQMQDALHQTRKLEAIGHLAAGIAHEINTPLQYTGDNTRFVQDAFGQVADVLATYESLLEAARAAGVAAENVAAVDKALEAADVEYLLAEAPLAIEQSLEGIGRVVKIVRAMKDFSHPNVEEKAPTDLNNCLESTITICRNEWKYVAELTAELAEDLPDVVCSPGELNQVFLNLIVNAAQAIREKLGPSPPEKGAIRVITRRVGGTVEVRVADTGCGIPESIRSQVFNPFFTTKQVGTGTGQGLSIAHTMVADSHGGTIDFETVEGEGTTFIIRLPLAGPRTGEVPALEAAGTPA